MPGIIQMPIFALYVPLFVSPVHPPPLVKHAFQQHTSFLINVSWLAHRAITTQFKNVTNVAPFVQLVHLISPANPA